MARINRAKRRRALLYGCILFALLFTVASLVSVPRIEKDLTNRSRRALTDAGFQDASVEVDGRRVTIRGARSEADGAELEAAVRTVRGVARVSAEVGSNGSLGTAGPPDVPALELSLEANVLTLRGQVPDRTLKDSLVAAASRALGADHLVDEVNVRATPAPADGAVDDVNALASVLGPLSKLLVSGLVTLNERELEVAGLPRAGVGRTDVDAALSTAQTTSPGLTVVNSVRAGAGEPSAGSATAAPPAANITIDILNGGITMSGVAASEAQHQRLAGAAVSAFGTGKVNDLLTAPASGTNSVGTNTVGADPGDQPATTALAELVATLRTSLSFGRFTVVATSLSIDGFANDAAGKAAIEAAVAKVGAAGFTVTGGVDAPAPPGGKDLVTRGIEDQLNLFVRLQPIAFASASAEISPTSAPTVDQAASLLRAVTGVTVTIEGHTDNTGDPSLNQSLSQRRADAVRVALIARGVPDALVAAVGYGDSRPRADNATEAGRQENRRVQFDVHRV